MGVDVLVTYDADFADLLFGDECEQVKRIVRCKDCKFYKEEETRWDTVEWCLLQKENGGDAVMVDPDGFCAWGERREDD